jgi:predicted dehydrogenase
VIELFGASKVRQEYYEAFGSDDVFAVVGGTRFGRPNSAGGLDEIPIPEDLALAPTPDVPLLAPFRAKVAMLREAILGGKPAAPTFTEAVEVQKVLDAARKSDQMGTWVEVEE